MSGRDVTFYTVSNARYYLGTVALLNSLRLTGHREPLVVLDTGLSERQRDRLDRHCIIVDLPADLGANVLLSKPFPCFSRPRGTVVLIDSDVIVTQSLDHILIQAEKGRICAVPDPDDLRWHAEWRELFNLVGDLRRQTYVNAGFLAFSASQWPQLLDRWWRACQQIPPHRVTFSRVAAPGAKIVTPDTPPRHGSRNPVADGDQDALNALLMSEIPAEALALEPADVEVFHSDLVRARMIDARALACTYKERPTMLLHHNGGLKPWETSAWAQVRRDPYVRLLPRLLLGKDVTLQVDRGELPVWLAGGIRGHLTIGILELLHVVFAAALDRMPDQPSWRVRHVLHRLAALYSRT